jgi:hypothetical protein
MAILYRFLYYITYYQLLKRYSRQAPRPGPGPFTGSAGRRTPSREEPEAGRATFGAAAADSRIELNPARGPGGGADAGAGRGRRAASASLRQRLVTRLARPHDHDHWHTRRAIPLGPSLPGSPRPQCSDTPVAAPVGPSASAPRRRAGPTLNRGPGRRRRSRPLSRAASSSLYPADATGRTVGLIEPCRRGYSGRPLLPAPPRRRRGCRGRGASVAGGHHDHDGCRLPVTVSRALGVGGSVDSIRRGTSDTVTQAATVTSEPTVPRPPPGPGPGPPA